MADNQHGALKDKTDSTSKEATGKSADARSKTLDDLLSEWDEVAAKGNEGDGKTSEATQESKDSKALMERIDRLERERAETQYRSDMSRVVDMVKGDLDVDGFLVESWVNQRAEQDDRLVKLWENRTSRKREFDAAMKALASEFGDWAKERGLAKDEKQARRSLASAVANARESSTGNNTMSDINFGALNDSEFALKKAEVFRMAETGQL